MRTKFIKDLIKSTFFIVIIIISMLCIIGAIVAIITRPEARIIALLGFGGVFLLCILNWAFTDNS